VSSPLVYGHRGAPRRAVENTIESFDAAEALGVDGIELDVRVTACGELVLHHDPDFHSGGRQYMLSTLTMRELAELVPERDGRAYRIPTLRDVFERYGHSLRYFVELKACNVPTAGIYEHAVARLLRRYGLVAHCLVLSFSSDLVRRIAAVDPAIPTSLVFEHPAAISELGVPGSPFPRVSALHPKHTILDAALAERAAAQGLPIHTWTVNDPEALAKVVPFGVASVTTDEPDEILRALGREPFPRVLPGSPFSVGRRGAA
jgi:glycerophosphoryl diester phosphodiesterase